MLGKLFILNLLFSVLAIDTDGVWLYDTIATITDQGYQAENHYVTTSDGYIIQMHRIPYKRYENTSNVSDRPVVMLMHGLMGSSDAFIFLGPEYAMAFNMADAGFDVWLGNARGNVHSRYHHTLDPDHNEEKYEFFDFSWEEIGTSDLPTMIDYILEYTGQAKLHYIGHSQGGTVFLVLNSMRPEYNQKIESAHLLAGVGYMEYFPNEELISMARMVDFIYSMALTMGIVELYSPTPAYNLAENSRISDYCTGDIKFKHMCILFGVPQILGERNSLVDSILDLFGISGSAGAALKQIAHYGQNIRDKTFRRWHYGSIGSNLANYGDSSPPKYNLSLITINTCMHYTVNDNLLDERDVLNMAADMPNTKVRKVARESFLHEDFVIAIDAKELVTDYIIEAIRGGSTEEDTNGTEVVDSEEVVDKEEVVDQEEVDEVIVVEGSVTTETEEETNVDGGSSAVLINILLLTISVGYCLWLPS